MRTTCPIEREYDNAITAANANWTPANVRRLTTARERYETTYGR